MLVITKLQAGGKQIATLSVAYLGVGHRAMSPCETTHISVVFVFSNLRKMGKFAASIESPKAN